MANLTEKGIISGIFDNKTHYEIRYTPEGAGLTETWSYILPEKRKILPDVNISESMIGRPITVHTNEKGIPLQAEIDGEPIF